jgi:hypothetical protein
MTAEPMAERHPRVRMGKIWKTRRQRAELLAAIQGVEYTIAIPPSDPAWRHGVAAELGRLRAAFNAHVELTEGPEGLYAEVVGDAPRLANTVSTLHREHAAVSAMLDTVVDQLERGHFDDDPAKLRAWAAQLLRDLSQHRQRGADLVYEAYATDIGGEN